MVLRVGFDGKAYRIPTQAMDPTLKMGDRLIAVGESNPERGEIVLINPPSGAIGRNECGVRRPKKSACRLPTEGQADITFVKRVVGLGGDSIRFVRGRIVVNGEALDAPRCVSKSGSLCHLPREITVPTGHLFLVGDKLEESDDSRLWGPVPADYVHRRPLFRYWPPDRIGEL